MIPLRYSRLQSCSQNKARLPLFATHVSCCYAGGDFSKERSLGVSYEKRVINPVRNTLWWDAVQSLLKCNVFQFERIP